VSRDPEGLIAAAVDHQRRVGLSDREMAHLLRIHRLHWWRVVHGLTPAGIKVVRGLLRVFPHLEPEVLAYLRGNGTEREVRP